MGVDFDYGDIFEKRIAVTGGAGFIGSNLLLYLVPRYPDYLFVNIDCLTYAGNLFNLKSLEQNRNYRFKNINIKNYRNLQSCFDKYKINAIIHLAAETHVDRSIYGPAEFVNSNIIGAYTLLELARQRVDDFRFHYISTDEVYGSLTGTGQFKEVDRFDPSSPYAASKAAGDLLVKAYHKTYGLNTIISNCTNNFGPYQFPEKLIPLVIRNSLAGEKIPIYGDGLHVRDWLFVEDHCRAIDLIFHSEQSGLTFNVCGRNEMTNLELVKKLCRIIDGSREGQSSADLIEFVEDRPGHDRRYALDSSLIEHELGWKPEFEFDKALQMTVEWYMKNQKWLDECISGEYKEYYKKNYTDR